MEVLVTKMKYYVESDHINVVINARTEKGERKKFYIKDCEPYFFVRSEQEPRDHPCIKRVEKKGKDLLNRDLWKITTKIPADIRRIRDNYTFHYEADIPFTDRVRIDYGIRSQIRVPEDTNILTKQNILPVARTIEPEIVYFDIETDDSRGFAHPDYAAFPVFCLDLYTTQYDKHILIIEGDVDKDKIRRDFKEMCQKHFNDDGPEVVIKQVDTERQIFSKFREVLHAINPDIITGWNVEFFDVSYIKNRALGQAYSRPDFREFGIFDLMQGYERLHKGKAYMKLEHVAQQELGVGKLPRDKISAMFKSNKEKLCLYNIWDTEITRRIDGVRNIINRHSNFSWFAGADIEKSVTSEPLFDKYILHEIGGKVRLPSKDMLKKTGIDQGAYVDTPVKGRYSYVSMVDFASMYPRTIVSFNVSPETRLDDNYDGPEEHFTLPSGRKYRKSPKGFIPLIVEKLMKERDNVKAEMRKFEKGTREYKMKNEEQTAVKYFTNAAYGIVGSEVFRLADGDVASDITHVGRILIEFTMKEVGKMGYKPLYADTDSVFFETGATSIEDAVKIGKEVEYKLNNLYPELAAKWNGKDECQHNIKNEKVYQAWIQSGAKKRHAGLVGWDVDTEDKFITHLPPKTRLSVIGFEIVRSNASKITKKVQEDILIIALQEEDYWSALHKYVSQLHKDFYNRKYDKDLLIPASRNKLSYASRPAHFRAVEYSTQNEMLEVQIGDPYSWCYVKGVKGKPPTDVVALDLDVDAVPDEVQINYDKMWHRNVEKPLKKILEALDIKMDELITGQKQSTLF